MVYSWLYHVPHETDFEAPLAPSKWEHPTPKSRTWASKDDGSWWFYGDLWWLFRIRMEKMVWKLEGLWWCLIIFRWFLKILLKTVDWEFDGSRIAWPNFWFSYPLRFDYPLLLEPGLNALFHQINGIIDGFRIYFLALPSTGNLW